MNKKTFAFIVCSVALSLVSCDKDPIEISSDIFGDDPFGFEKYQVQSLQTQLVNTGEVSTRNLPQNTLGVYKDEVFGTTEARFVSQVELGKDADFTKIGKNPVLDSVYVYIPYNSTIKSGGSEGGASYTLNNVYGKGKFDLSVYENGYFLREQDPNNDFQTQQYYSDQKALFDSNKKGVSGNQRLNNSVNKAQNTEFKASAEEIVLYKYNAEGELQKDSSGNPVVKERKKPGVWLDLDKAYFQQRFFGTNAYTSLSTNTNLKEFFRGLYFNVDNAYQENLMMQLDLSAAELVFIYKEDDKEADKPRRRKKLTLTLGNSSSSGNVRNNVTVNLFSNSNSTAYEAALAAKDNDHLWIKGNVGSLAKIHMISSQELQQVKDNNWLINQAVLTVYVDQSLVPNASETSPSRLYLYDLKNNMPIVDYVNDASTTPFKNGYNGFLDEKTEGNSIKYRFRVTEHLKNLITKDSTNFDLGLAVANDISNPLMTYTKNKTLKPNQLPVTMASMPFGTVIFGATYPEVAKRTKLEIYYTKQN